MHERSAPCSHDSSARTSGAGSFGPHGFDEFEDMLLTEGKLQIVDRGEMEHGMRTVPRNRNAPFA